MKALTIIKGHMDLAHAPGLAGAGLEMVTIGGASYGIGQVYHRWGDEDGVKGWIGRNLPVLLAIGGKLGAAAVQIATDGKGHHLGSAFLNGLGNAGLGAYFLEKGLQHARESTGKQVVMLPAGSAVPAGAKPVTAIGGGKALPLSDIEKLRSMA